MKKQSSIIFIIIVLLFGTIIYYFYKETGSNNIEKESKIKIVNKESSETTTDEMIRNIKEKSYESFTDFQDYDMNFIDDDTFNIIREIYSKIDFSSEYKQCDPMVNDFYKKIYNELLKGKVKFIDKEMNKEFYINEYDPIKDYNNSFGFDVNNYCYYFFDIDEDNAPELCVFNSATGTNIFKYIIESDKIILWCRLETCWYHINGSKTITWNNDGKMFAFYKLDENGKIINVVFLSYSIYNDNKSVYLVTLPGYSNKYVSTENMPLEIIDKVKKQGYFDESNRNYYFRVTESQFNELYKNYSEAIEISLKNIQNVTFSYDELFGN